MSRVFKQSYTKPIPEGAEFFEKKGERFARFRNHRGKLLTAPLTEDGQRIRLESEKWYGRVPGDPRPVALFTNEQASEKELQNRIDRVEKGQAGLADPHEEHKKRPLQEHLDDWEKSILARGKTARAAREMATAAKRVFDACGFVFFKDVKDTKVEDFLTDLRTPAAPAVALDPARDRFPLAEVARLLSVGVRAVRTMAQRHGLPTVAVKQRRFYPRATVEALLEIRRRRGSSATCSNGYLTAVKGFFKWAVRRKRFDRNPLDDLKLVNRDADPRHLRRELTADELRRLLAATRDSRRVFRDMTGRDRYHLYALACGTGFRASALASLTPESFDLDATRPIVTLAARFNKSRKTKVQPLPADVAELMRAYLVNRPAGVRLWGTPWAEERRGAEMLRGDLAEANVPYVVEGAEGPLFADFHSLRHSYLTLGGRAGIDLRTLQELAGHSKPNMTARYTHVRLHDLAGAVEKLPSILPDLPPTTPLKATGTAGELPTREVVSLSKACHSSDRPCVLLTFPDSELVVGRGTGEQAQPIGVKPVESSVPPATTPDASTPNLCPEGAMSGTTPGQSASQSAILTSSCGDGPGTLAPGLSTPPDPDLARVVAAWGTLPPHVRGAILLLITSTPSGSSS